MSSGGSRSNCSSIYSSTWIHLRVALPTEELTILRIVTYFDVMCIYIFNILYILLCRLSAALSQQTHYVNHCANTNNAHIYKHETNKHKFHKYTIYENNLIINNILFNHTKLSWVIPSGVKRTLLFIYFLFLFTTITTFHVAHPHTHSLWKCARGVEAFRLWYVK